MRTTSSRAAGTPAPCVAALIAAAGLTLVVALPATARPTSSASSGQRIVSSRPTAEAFGRAHFSKQLLVNTSWTPLIPATKCVSEGECKKAGKSSGTGSSRSQCTPTKVDGISCFAVWKRDFSRGRQQASEPFLAAQDTTRIVSLSYDQVKARAAAYKAAHPGNGGREWDINAKTPAQLASDRAAARLVSICGVDQRPVIPVIAWEYGGMDHQWTDPSASALVYCVYIPVRNATSHWRYDAAATRVIADVYVKYPNRNPCRTTTGRDQVAGCIGDVTNLEILVDTASLHDGADAGLSLADASTELRLIMPDGSRVRLVVNR
ncbi:MAG TPA: hypothetical protein VGO31_01785 [Microbacteriaceae bacterium]|jgi:hypothetical protein|nr:hypothetical protein [Microbacteriaceae bacterium]